jgi:hypothetical protein
MAQAVLSSQRRGPGSHPGQSMWDLCWTKCQWAGFSPISLVFLLLFIIPPLLHTHLSPLHEMCNSSDQAAHYHTLGPKLGASSPP